MGCSGSPSSAFWHLESSTFTPGHLDPQERSGLGDGVCSCCGRGAGIGPTILTELAGPGLLSAGPRATSLRPELSLGTSRGLCSDSLCLQVWDQGGWPKKNKGEEGTGYAFKELHTQACVLAAKHWLVGSTVEARELGRVLQKHHRTEGSPPAQRFTEHLRGARPRDRCGGIATE